MDIVARYYDSRTGTFCSADPLAGSPGDPQSWNRYPYGRNDPIDITDPSGKSWWSSLLIDVGIGVAAYFLGPELDTFLAGSGGAAATTGEVAHTIYYGSQIIGQGSATYAWGAISATYAGGMSAALQAGNKPSQSVTRKPHNPCNDTNAMDFTKSHAADAASVATKLHVPTENVLGLSGAESLWGANRFATQGNNFFSLQGDSNSPFANGQMGAQGSSAVLSKFPSYLASAQSFAAQYGTRVFGIQNGQAFATALTPKFNNLNAAKGGDPDFIKKTGSVIDDTKKRMKCLGIGG